MKVQPKKNDRTALEVGCEKFRGMLRRRRRNSHDIEKLIAAENF